uniref:KOW domain-containing protein n=1 Tax=viral metagenome TaxID=1070528 RepID=A0A6C0H6J7_9ZZZZ
MNFFEISGNKAANKIKNTPLQPHCDLHTVYKNVHVGEMVKVVRLEGGLYNCYKGYIGEVKDYKLGQDSALVMLHAVNCPKVLRMPLEHFIKLHQ